MTELFRNKTIKCERRDTANKKSKDYDIVGEKHKTVIEMFDNNALELPLLYKKVKRIDTEIQQLETEEGIHNMVLDLNYKLQILLDEKSEFAENDSENDELPKKKAKKTKTKKVKKTKKSIFKKSKSIVIEHGNEQEIILNNIMTKISETEEKINIIGRTFSRKSYINDLKRKRARFIEKIEDIENNVDEIDYFTKSISILSKYYDAPATVVEEKEISVLELFEKQKEYIPDNSERYYLVDEYLLSINEQKRYKRPNLGRICEVCNIPKLLNNQESSFSCSRCGAMEYIIMDPEKPSYNAGTEQKNNSYRRINHCTEKLNQSQGKESTDIDPELMKDIMKELYVRGIEDLSKVNAAEIKSVLKSINQSHKSEHAEHIAAKINGVPTKTIPYHLVEIIKAMWKLIEEAWLEIKDSTRKNFMNSSFLFHKIFELLDEPEEAEKWPYLADDKLKVYDEDWEKICKKWNWDFIRSI